MLFPRPSDFSSSQIANIQPTCQKSMNTPTTLDFQLEKQKYFWRTKSILKCFSLDQFKISVQSY